MVRNSAGNNSVLEPGANNSAAAEVHNWVLQMMRAPAVNKSVWSEEAMKGERNRRMLPVLAFHRHYHRLHLVRKRRMTEEANCLKIASIVGK